VEKRNIPFASGTPEYYRAYQACRHYGRTYDKLTDQERAWKPDPASAPQAPALQGSLTDAIQKLNEARTAATTAQLALASSMEALTQEVAALSLELQAMRLELIQARAARTPAGGPPG
jgi:hypothetical protein